MQLVMDRAGPGAVSTPISCAQVQGVLRPLLCISSGGLSTVRPARTHQSFHDGYVRHWSKEVMGSDLRSRKMCVCSPGG